MRKTLFCDKSVFFTSRSDFYNDRSLSVVVSALSELSLVLTGTVTCVSDPQRTYFRHPGVLLDVLLSFYRFYVFYVASSALDGCALLLLRLQSVSPELVFY